MSGSKEFETIVYTSWQKFHDGNMNVIDDIYPELMPFCLRICSRTCGRYIDDGDEEASIARMSIIEAFEHYEPDKGHILGYLGRVIHNRIIDYKRSQKRTQMLRLDDLNQRHLDDEQIEALVEEMARSEEIKRFKAILNSFSIEFAELVSSSPRQKKTRDTAKKIAVLIAENQELKTYLLEKRKLPAKPLEEKYRQDRKLIDRYRKYILAAALIRIYDLRQLKEYIWTNKGGTDRG